ncbi:MAG: Gfo/Idh/MocA family oxidoreductase [Armatimonadetes bacterium]|nr:Gfo/Idh/MocA family oxidoreductase [Armatimonadota bacterium]
MSVRVGFIGCGGIANHHMNCMKEVKGAEMVAFCDIDASRAAAAAEKFGGKAYTDYYEMLDRESLQAAWIALPPFAHTDQEIAAARKGVHIFVEKPIATTLTKAREILKAVQDNGVLAGVGYHWRNMEVTDRAKEILAGKTLGMMLGYWMGGMPGVHWWRVMAESGGQFVEQTTHIVDLARYFGGEVETVYAATATRALGDVPDFDVSDVGSVILKFKSGVVATISNTCLLKMGYTVGLHLIAPDTILEISGGLKVIQSGRTEDIRNTNNPTIREDQTFIDAILSGDGSRIRSPYEDALKSLAVSLAINESAATGQPAQVEG